MLLHSSCLRWFLTFGTILLFIAQTGHLQAGPTRTVSKGDFALWQSALFEIVEEGNIDVPDFGKKKKTKDRAINLTPIQDQVFNLEGMEGTCFTSLDENLEFAVKNRVKRAALNKLNLNYQIVIDAWDPVAQVYAKGRYVSEVLSADSSGVVHVNIELERFVIKGVREYQVHFMFWSDKLQLYIPVASMPLVLMSLSRSFGSAFMKGSALQEVKISGEASRPASQAAKTDGGAQMSSSTEEAMAAIAKLKEGRKQWLAVEGEYPDSVVSMGEQAAYSARIRSQYAANRENVELALIIVDSGRAEKEQRVPITYPETFHKVTRKDYNETLVPEMESQGWTQLGGGILNGELKQVDNDVKEKDKSKYVVKVGPVAFDECEVSAERLGDKVISSSDSWRMKYEFPSTEGTFQHGQVTPYIPKFGFYERSRTEYILYFDQKAKTAEFPLAINRVPFPSWLHRVRVMGPGGKTRDGLVLVVNPEKMLGLTVYFPDGDRKGRRDQK